MTRNEQRQQRLVAALASEGLDALVCTLPPNILLLTGYWPFLGPAIACVTRSGSLALLVPEDEREHVGPISGSVRAYAAASLKTLQTPLELLEGALVETLRNVGLPPKARLGTDSAARNVPAPYISVLSPGMAPAVLIRHGIPDAEIVSVSELLANERAVLVGPELEQLRVAVRLSEKAFVRGQSLLQPGLSEKAVAELFRSALTDAAASEKVERAGGDFWCRSGPNSAKASAAYQFSTHRAIADGDVVLIHCNSQVGGYWTDLTRTFYFGALESRWQEIYRAVFSARDAALGVIRAGARACDVDAAARKVIQAIGYGSQFKHSTGHGVGFSAADHTAKPRLHPASDDELVPGMVFNVEPAVYVDGQGGIRHCDMVLVGDHGPEILTPFISTVVALRVV